MKKFLTLLIATFLLLSIRPVLADDSQVITLKDGSQIKGELVSVAGGIYTVRTPNIGEIKINSSQVVSISNGAAVAPPPYAYPPQQAASDDGLNQKIQSAQSILMNSPEMMAQLQVMMQDPEMMTLLSDPSVTQAVMAHDVKAIQNNPKAQALMNNPKMKALMDKLRNSSNSS